MYVAAKGGEKAIAASLELLDRTRRGDPSLPQLQSGQVREQLRLGVDRVMAEASLFDRELAADAVRQARGDLVEAIFLLRAYRTTLPRWGCTEPIDTARMRAQRRVSAIFKDLPGGQILGPTFDYALRLLGAEAAHTQPATAAIEGPVAADTPPPMPEDDDARDTTPNPLDALAAEGLLEPCVPSPGDPLPPDITRDPPVHPLPRAARLQMLARADEGWLLGLAYATQRGYGDTHPFVGDIRMGHVTVQIELDEVEGPVTIGEIEVTDCQMVNRFVGGNGQPARFTRGQGLVFGHGERKAMAMALLDRAMRADEFGERRTSPSQDSEFVLAHGDNVEASGFVQHLKLPHHVTFESEVSLVRALRAESGT